METEIRAALRRVIDPELRRSIVDLGMVRDLTVSDGTVAFTLALTTAGCPLRDQLAEEARGAVRALPGVRNVIVTLGEMSTAERNAAFDGGAPPPLAAQLNNIRRVIAVMSGKGGVGKSLVTGLLASAIARAGYRVGVLDADVTGPSIPKLLGAGGLLMGGPLGIEPVESRAGSGANAPRPANGGSLGYGADRRNSVRGDEWTGGSPATNCGGTRTGRGWRLRLAGAAWCTGGNRLDGDLTERFIQASRQAGLTYWRWSATCSDHRRPIAADRCAVCCQGIAPSVCHAGRIASLPVAAARGSRTKASATRRRSTCAVAKRTLQAWRLPRQSEGPC
jgi:metal-sulfur cluster biosynthetic enzyme